VSIQSDFEKRGYRFCGTGATEVCRWTKNAVTGRGVCYKQKFYGIPAHKCMEFSPSALFCTNNCTYCWRPKEYLAPPENADWTKPDEMIDCLIRKRKKLLDGFGGNPKADKKILKSAFTPVHFAISLSGEPTIYPHLSEMIEALKRRPDFFSVYLVTNGQHPSALHSLRSLPTQIYLSLTAPTSALYKKVSAPLAKDAWKKLLQSCDFVSGVNTRTVARVTPIKGWNMSHAKDWAELLRRCNPHFVEFKGYSWIGFSKMRLKLENVPTMQEVRDFASEVAGHAGNLVFEDEDARSRVVLYKNAKRPIERFIRQ
jgi:tRNA wybutosine-synthesizing protein 1